MHIRVPDEPLSEPRDWVFTATIIPVFIDPEIIFIEVDAEAGKFTVVDL